MFSTPQESVAEIKRSLRRQTSVINAYNSAFYNGDPFFEVYPGYNLPYNYSGLGFMSIDKNNLEFRTGYTYANFGFANIQGTLVQGLSDKTSTIATVTLNTPIQFAENKVVRYNYVIPENRIAMTFANVGYLSGNQHVLLNGTYNLSANGEYTNTFTFETSTFAQAITANVVASVYVANFTQSNIHIHPEYINHSTKLVTMTGDNIKVGIGTNNPESILHLKSAGPAEIIIEADSDNITETDNARIIFKQDGSAVTGRVGYETGGNVFEIVNAYNDNLYGGISFKTATTTKMFVHNAGNVGVGFTNPDIYGKLAVSGSLFLSGETSPYTAPSELAVSVDEANRTNTYITFAPAGAVNDWAYLRQIGGSNLYHMSLDLHDDGNSVSTGQAFSIRATNSAANPDSAPLTRVHIDGNGNLGINTSTPNERLTVNGSISATGRNIYQTYTNTGTVNSTSNADLTVDASITTRARWVANFCSVSNETLNVSNLTNGREVFVFVRNTGSCGVGESAVITVRASTSTTSFSNVECSNNGGAVRSSVTLANTSGTAVIWVANIENNFVGAIF